MIRSYHKVGRDFTETRIHVLGKRPDGQPIVSPIPLPLMGLVWAIGSFVVLLVIGRALGIANLPHHPHGGAAYGPAMLFHIALPVAIAYVMTMAEVEGRHVHVVIRAWAAQSITKHLVGGYKPARTAGDSIRYRRMKVRDYA